MHNSEHGHETREVCLIDNWLAHIEDVKRFHNEKFKDLNKSE